MVNGGFTVASFPFCLQEDNLRKANEAIGASQPSRRSQVVTFSAEGSSPGTANSNEMDSGEQISHE